ncbi:MAG: DUF697 domain-containing protein [Magnetococcales bacterium]|nr:DUF697 domain-containing protein [Magnetococcales bacterium]MBF0157364.1 DUF697 domain-containing protein [Magnetococcales bacterium]
MIAERRWLTPVELVPDNEAAAASRRRTPLPARRHIRVEPTFPEATKSPAPPSFPQTAAASSSFPQAAALPPSFPQAAASPSSSQATLPHQPPRESRQAEPFSLQTEAGNTLSAPPSPNLSFLQPVELTPLPGEAYPEGGEGDADDDAADRKETTGIAAHGWTGGRRGRGWLLALGTLLTAVALLDTWQFLTARFADHWSLGLVFSLLFAFLGMTLGGLVWREYRSLKRLREWRGLGERLGRIRDGGGPDEAEPMLGRLGLLLQSRPDNRKGLERFHRQSDPHLGDDELIMLFEREVLAPWDREAKELIVREATAVAVMTAANPMVWIDGLLFLWRNLLLVRKIAEIYGNHPGHTGMGYLLRGVGRGLLGATATDVMAEGMAEILGGSLAAVVMAQLGEGMANGLFTARVGLQAMAVCRPIPFAAGERPRLGDLRREVLKAVTGTVGSKRISQN